MQLAKVLGYAIAPVRHPTLEGWRLLVVQPVGQGLKPDGDPIMVIDPMSARDGDWIIITSDGKGARELVGSDATPARWFVQGIVDGEPTTA